MIVIRPPDQAEFETARRILKAARLDPTTPLRFEHTLIAEIDGKVVGVGQIKHHADCQELGSLAVLPSYQHQGIGTQLMTALEARAERPLYLTCYDKMMPFYLGFGYETVRLQDAPGSFKLKLLLTQLFRLVGVRVYLMCKR